MVRLLATALGGLLFTTAGVSIAGWLSPVKLPGELVHGVYPVWAAGIEWKPLYQIVPNLALHTGLGVLGGLALTALTGRGVSESRERKTLHGSARWARLQDLRQAKLISGGGLYLGRFGSPTGRAVFSPNWSHVLVLGGTGFGKTSGVVVPNVLRCPHSLIVLDPKGAEVYQATAEDLSATHDVLAVEFASRESADRWNPLDTIPRGDGDVAMLQRLAGDFITTRRAGESDHWVESARALFVALGLHVLYMPGAAASLAGMRETLYSDAFVDEENSFRGVFEAMLRGGQKAPAEADWRDLHPELRQLAGRFARTPVRELGSVVSTCGRFLEFLGDPVVAANTAGSTFSLADLRDSKPSRPVALFVMAARSDLVRLAPLFRMMVAALTIEVSGKPRAVDIAIDPDEPRRVVLVVEEFPSLGNMPQVVDALATVRSGGMSVLLAAQDVSQIRAIYGANEGVTSVCPVWLSGASSNPETRELVSKATGEETRLHSRRGRSSSSAGAVLGSGRASTSSTSSETRRRLLTPGEAGMLGEREGVVFIHGLPPAKVYVPIERERE